MYISSIESTAISNIETVIIAYPTKSTGLNLKYLIGKKPEMDPATLTVPNNPVA